MNWTGGLLSRRSRGGATASLNQRQREHFAKIRNNLRNGTKNQSPMRWSVFGKKHVEIGDHERQFAVERREYRKAGLYVPSGRSLYSSNQTARGGHSIRSSERHHTQESISGVPVEHDPASDDNFHTATPAPADQGKPEASKNVVHGEGVDVIAKKRQRLLEKRDWVGMTYQRPLQMIFYSAEHADNVGRRKVTAGHRARYASRRNALGSPFMAHPLRYSLKDCTDPDHGGKTDVRIHIGDMLIPPGMSSSTAPSRRTRGHSRTQHIGQHIQPPSSDIMLLDNDDLQRNQLYQGINETLFVHQEAKICENSQHKVSACSIGASFADERDCDDDELGGNEQASNAHYGGDDFDSIRHRYTYSSIESEKRNSPSEYPTSPRLGNPCSPSLIKHPIPQSSRVSSILRSASSQTASSTLAQVAILKPAVPSSQVLDNEMWEDWVAHLNSGDSFQGIGKEDDIMQEIWISPGISTAPTRRINRPVSNIYQKQIKTVQAGGSNEVDNVSTRDNAYMLDPSSIGLLVEIQRPARGMSRGGSEGHSKTGGTLQITNKRSRPKSDLTIGINKAPKGVPFHPFENGLSRPTTTKSLLLAQSKILGRDEEDPDELWRKFVFGSEDTNEIEHVSGLSQSLPGSGRTSISSSILGNPPTDISNESHTYTERQSQTPPRHSDSCPQSDTPSTVWKINTTSSDIPWDPPKAVASAARVSSRDS